MLMRPILLVISGAVLGGCMAHAQVPTDDTHVKESPEDVCLQSNENRPPKIQVVNINYEGPEIKVSPPMVCARPGDVLKFQLNGSPKTLVTVEGKGVGDEWVSGGGNHQVFFVVVPFDFLPSAESYPEAVKSSFYTVTAYTEDGTKILDPEVRVRHNSQ